MNTFNTADVAVTASMSIDSAAKLDVDLTASIRPLFVLGPPRSFTSVVGAMLGQHPQMYGLPETHLFSYETMAARRLSCLEATYPMGHGLLRAVAELYFNEQNEATIKLADAWLRRRSHFTTGYLFEVLANKVYPRILVDKSPSVVYKIQFMQRIYDMFPEARFIHLLRHPRGHGESVMKYIEERKQRGAIPPTHWLLHLSTYPHRRENGTEPLRRCSVLDPQRGWYTLNRTIGLFLESVPENQKLQLRGEDVLTDPDRELQRVATWMGLRDDDEAIQEMKHPERSPYACFGPANARYGNDAHFLENPALRPLRGGKAALSLEGPLSWRADGAEFLPKVKLLARSFGYQ